MKGNWAILLLVLMVWTAIVAVYAVHADSPTGNVGNQVDLKEGITETTKTAINVSSPTGQIAFTDKTTGISVTTSTLIDDIAFVPAKTTIDKTITWDNALTNPDVSFEYIYTGNTVKEFITLKKDVKLSFPIKLSPDTKLIPWDNGQWKIVSSVSDDTMSGLIASKPYGIDAAGNRIEMEYTYDKGALNLDYSRNITIWEIDEKTELPIKIKEVPITYPLLIDPTWTATEGRFEATDGDYKIIKWNTTGANTWVSDGNATTVEVLVVGGGGSGGSFNLNTGPGGGGAGSMITNASRTVTGTITISVGAGGTSSTNAMGKNGTFSRFGTINATGGGGGAGSASSTAGLAGGSGGGGVIGGAGGAKYQPTPYNGTYYGNTGGLSGASGSGGGGGGGAGGVGGDYSTTIGGNGGAGIASTITGESLFYAGGGGAMGGTSGGIAGIGGSGIGGNGGNRTAAGKVTDGLAGTGSGGGSANVSTASGAGGNGVVIIRYVNTSPTASFTQDASSGMTPLSVQFNDTSSSGTSWSWGRKNLTDTTWTQFSTTQNATQSFVTGNWSINLTTTNAVGSNISTQIAWVNVSSVPWYNCDWGFRAPITINKTMVTASQTSFPVIINLSSDTGLVSSAQSTGNDILFTSSDGITKIPHEIESYTSATGALIAWVNTSVSASANTVIYMYYNNSAAANQQDATHVWDANYAGVWHLNTVFTDSTSNSNNGRNIGTTDIAGKISNARNFSGAQYIDAGGKSVLNITGTALTLEAWIYANPWSANIWENTIIGKDTGTSGYNIRGGSNDLSFIFADGVDWYVAETTSNPMSATTWYHVVGRYNGTRLQDFINGAPVLSTASTANIVNGNTNLTIGNGYDMARYFTGRIDEVRVSNLARSDTWISTEYNNQNRPDLFISVGADEAVFGCAVVSPPNSTFTYSPSEGTTPVSVQFNDTSTNTPTSWSWGRKNLTSTTWVQFNTTRNATQSFVVGNWSVNLTATNAGGSNISTQVSWVNVTAGGGGAVLPIVQWTIDKQTVRVPGTVTTVDTSLNTPTSWQWYWGDGSANGTSNQEQHKYVKRGVYQAQLTATNAAGSNTSSKQVRVIGYDQLY